MQCIGVRLSRSHFCSTFDSLTHLLRNFEIPQINATFCQNFEVRSFDLIEQPDSFVFVRCTINPVHIPWTKASVPCHRNLCNHLVRGPARWMQACLNSRFSPLSLAQLIFWMLTRATLEAVAREVPAGPTASAQRPESSLLLM